jgi:hypothetical protein
MPSKENPFKNSISFDNIGYAGVVIFQIISLTEWSRTMYMVQDAHSFWDWIFFVLLIIIGSFFLTKLCRVVIVTKFLEIKNREAIQQLDKEKNQFKEQKRMSSFKNLVYNLVNIWNMIKMLVKAINFHKIRTVLVKGRLVNETKERPIYMLSYDQFSIDNELRVPIAKPESSKVTYSSTESLNMDGTKKYVKNLGYKRFSASHCLFKDYLSKIKFKMSIISKSTWLSKCITILIIVDILLMCTEHHNQPEYLTIMIEYFNILFVILFTIVIISKIVTVGYLVYIREAYNILDFLIGFLRYFLYNSIFSTTKKNPIFLFILLKLI